MRQRTLDRLTQVLAIVAFGLALRYVVWRWRRVIDTSYWVRYVVGWVVWMCVCLCGMFGVVLVR